MASQCLCRTALRSRSKSPSPDSLTAVIVETEIETDSRWIAEVSAIPGALAYGDTRDSAIAAVEALVLRILTLHNL